MTKSLPIPLEGRPFNYQEARKTGLTQYALRRLLNSGELERIDYNLYRATGEDLSEEELYRRATKKVGKRTAICLLSALTYYGLTDTIAKQIWVMVEASKRIKSPNIKLYRARDPRWKIGIVEKQGYSITSLERTVVDSLTLKSVVSPRIGIEALKKAISNHQTTASKILEIASRLGVKHRILAYIEVLT